MTSSEPVVASVTRNGKVSNMVIHKIRAKCDGNFCAYAFKRGKWKGQKCTRNMGHSGEHEYNQDFRHKVHMGVAKAYLKLGANLCQKCWKTEWAWEMHLKKKIDERKRDDRICL